MAKETESSRTVDHWKRKFYASLDELEQKEKEWSELERLLRTLASRLSFAADGRNRKLDKQLDVLREALRNERNAYKLAKIIEEITSQVSGLDLTGSAITESPDLSRPLSRLLDHLTIPVSLERQEKFVRRKLSKASDVAAVDDVVRDLAELLGLMINTIAEARKTGTAEKPIQQAIKESTIQEKDPESAGKEKSGLFSGLFGKNKNAPEAGSTTEKMPVASSKKILQATDSEEGSASKLQESGQAENEESRSLTLAADILIRLLERLQLPGDLHIQADLIKGKLEPCEAPVVLAKGLEATADLLAELSRRVQAERKALEDFLIQLTRRLQELDIDIRETVKLRDQSHQAGQQINSVVNDEVNQIEQSVQTAVDLDSLKTAIQSRVILIRDHMDHFLREEEGRFGDSEKFIKKLNSELQQANRETEALRQQVMEARQAAMRDQLTGIPNRMSYDENIAAELARFRRYQKPFTLMVWDVDKFKDVNDTYGHAAGDKVLCIIARLLEQNVRETDHLARYGGEEFVIILPETSLQQAALLAEKLRKGVEGIEFHFRGKRVPITASCGMAEIRAEEDSLELFQRADAVLYRAKENGRNRVELAD